MYKEAVSLTQVEKCDKLRTWIPEQQSQPDTVEGRKPREIDGAEQKWKRSFNTRGLW